MKTTYERIDGWIDGCMILFLGFCALGLVIWFLYEILDFVF